MMQLELRRCSVTRRRGSTICSKAYRALAKELEDPSHIGSLALRFRRRRRQPLVPDRPDGNVPPATTDPLRSISICLAARAYRESATTNSGETGPCFWIKASMGPRIGLTIHMTCAFWRHRARSLKLARRSSRYCRPHQEDR
jgi:hypothetical protein